MNPALRVRKILLCLASCAATVSLLSACGTTFTAAVMDDLGSKHRKTGVRYYLPQDMIQVTVQVQTRPQSEISKCTDKEKKTEGNECRPDKLWKLEQQEAAVEPLDMSVELMTVADTSYPMLFDTNGVAFGKSDSTITVSEHGLLQGINAKSQGTAGTVLQSVLKLVATAAALPSLPFPTKKNAPAPQDAPAAAPTDQPSGAAAPSSAKATSAEDRPAYALNAVGRTSDPTIAELTIHRALSEVALLDPAAVRAKGSACMTVKDDGFMADYVSESKVLRYGFQELPDEVRPRLRRNVCNALAALDKSEQRMRDAQDKVVSASTRDTIYVATRKLTLLRSEYEADLAMATVAAAELRTQAEALAKQKGYGGAATVETKKYTWRLSDIANGATWNGQWQSLQALRAGVAAALQNRQGDQGDAFRTASLVLSLDEIPAPTKGSNNHTGVQTVPSNCGVAIKQKAAAPGTAPNNKAAPCIYHRVARPMLLTGWTPGAEQADDGKEVSVLKPVGSRMVDVVDNRSIVQAIDLHSSVWTKRDFAITFTPQGRLVSVRRDYGSAGEDATAGLEQGLSGALTQYQSSLGTVKSIRETQNALELMPFQQQLALAGAQNNLQLLPLQQQLALATAQSSLTIQPINAQLAEATAQLNLIKMQGSLEANQGGYSAAVQAQIADIERTLINAQQLLLASQATLANQPTAGQTAAMMAEIARLRSEIDLIKIRKELEELKN